MWDPFCFVLFRLKNVPAYPGGAASKHDGTVVEFGVRSLLAVLKDGLIESNLPICNLQKGKSNHTGKRTPNKNETKTQTKISEIRIRTLHSRTTDRTRTPTRHQG